MAYTQTLTSLGSLSSVAAGAWVPMPRNGWGSVSKTGPLLKLDASAVTTGLTLEIEAINDGQQGQTAVRSMYTLPITANGSTVLPLQDLGNGRAPDKIRLNVTSRTDGTVAGNIVTAP